MYSYEYSFAYVYRARAERHEDADGAGERRVQDALALAGALTGRRAEDRAERCERHFAHAAHVLAHVEHAHRLEARRLRAIPHGLDARRVAQARLQRLHVRIRRHAHLHERTEQITRASTSTIILCRYEYAYRTCIRCNRAHHTMHNAQCTSTVYYTSKLTTITQYVRVRVLH